MKTTHLLLSFSLSLLSFAAFGCASPTGDDANASADPSDTTDQDLSRDACMAKARAAAIVEYGNSPDGTHVKTLTKGSKYRVTVGINNEEDGPHDFYVTFSGGCSSTPSVTEVPWLAHPLRDATHAAYTAILSSNANEMTSSNAVALSKLPSSAKKQVAVWSDPAHSVCTAVKTYEVDLPSGDKTFAVTCDIPRDSIKWSLAIYDAQGADIDQASIYYSNKVGDNGVSWQNETFLQQD
jgi:hypothetical protein